MVPTYEQTWTDFHCETVGEGSDRGHAEWDWEMGGGEESSEAVRGRDRRGEDEPVTI